MLVVDCCDDCPVSKATNRCLPGTVHRGGWRLVDIIVVGCYAYSTQLKLFIFLKIGFLVIAKGLTQPIVSSEARAQKTLHPTKNFEKSKMSLNGIFSLFIISF